MTTIPPAPSHDTQWIPVTNARLAAASNSSRTPAGSPAATSNAEPSVSFPGPRSRPAGAESVSSVLYTTAPRPPSSAMPAAPPNSLEVGDRGPRADAGGGHHPRHHHPATTRTRGDLSEQRETDGAEHRPGRDDQRRPQSRGERGGDGDPQHPRLRAVAERYRHPSLDLAEEFEFGLERVLDGIAVYLDRRR